MLHNQLFLAWSLFNNVNHLTTKVPYAEGWYTTGTIGSIFDLNRHKTFSED